MSDDREVAKRIIVVMILKLLYLVCFGFTENCFSLSTVSLLSAVCHKLIFSKEQI